MSTIKTKPLRALLTILFSISLLCTSAQEADNSREDEVLGLTQFYEYMLNTLGSASTTQRDKDVIITESFTKAFANKEVQVEDDLLDNRKVITNKDIHAYLRDVDFFFQHVNFKFDSVKITQERKPNDDIFYLVSFEKAIEGTSLEGLPIKKIQKRFLEVNIDEENSDLKIVSVYTTKVSREKELRDWYNTLSFGWLSVLEQYVSYDSIHAEVLQQMADIDSINLADNQFLRNISPLVALKNLKYLNISNTSISDLSPIRYSTSIETIIANNTLIKDLSALQYFDNVRRLELANSEIEAIDPIKKLEKLEKLDLSENELIDFSPISKLTSLKSLSLSKTTFSNPSHLNNMEQLTSLNIAQTRVTDVSHLANLIQLKNLDVSETSLLNVNGLENHPSLETLDISQTLVNSLTPLSNLKNLKKVEADLSDIRSDDAIRFMEDHPGVVVVINSEELKNWWDSLSVKWQDIFKNEIGFQIPSKEDLIKVTNIDSLDLSNLNESDFATPLEKLRKLHYLDVSNNPISSFDFTREMSNLAVLIADNTAVKSTIGLNYNISLSYLSLKESQVEDIAALGKLKRLAFLDLNDTSIPQDQIQNFIKTNPTTSVLWRTGNLQSWWNDLDKSWKTAFDLSNPSSLELHQLTHSQKIELSGMEIREFGALDIFLNLNELYLDQVGLLNFNGLSGQTNLVKLSCINGPLQSVEGLDGMTQLKELIISNTAIADLQLLTKNSSIVKLDCSGTNIKKLKGLESLESLEYLNISNTNVFKLDRLEGSKQLKDLICFNTRLRQQEVNEFQEKFTKCKIVFY